MNLRRSIDLFIVWIHLQPGCSSSKSRIFRVIPLHRSPGIVPAPQSEITDHILFADQSGARQFIVIINTLNISIFLDAFKINIGHPKLFPLINIRGSLHHMQTRGKHFGRYFPVLGRIVPIPRNRSGLIMIIPIKTVPRFSFQLCLPFTQHFF